MKVKFNGEDFYKVEIRNERIENDTPVGDIDVYEKEFSGTFPMNDMAIWDQIEEYGIKYFLIPASAFELIQYIPEPEAEIQ